MNNKKTKLCLLMLVMFLGACEVSNTVLAKEENKPVAISEVNQEEVKANKETLEKAEQALSNKDYQSAIVYLTAYINSKPKKYEAYKLRGDAFYALHQFRLAEADYQKAIVLKADDDKFVTGTKVLSAVVLGADKQSQYQNPELGNLYGRLMYAQKALNNPAYESTYAKAFEYNSHIYLPKPKKEDIAKINCPQKYGKLLNPQGVDEYIMDAISKLEEGDFHAAVFKAQYVTSNYPKYYLGHYLLGVAMAGMEQYDDAVHSFETALKYNPYDFESFASLGQLFYRKAEKTFSADDARKSIEYFGKAIKYNPHYHIYHYYIGLNQMIIGDYNLAVSSFESAIKLKSNDYNSMYYKLVAQHIKGDYLSVIDGTTNLLYRHVSNYNSVLYLRALAYYKSGKSDLALTDLEKVHNNMNDIYNDDVRPLSKKEQTLSNYLYYLKSQILQDLGSGVKADLAKAYENPIIAELADGQISSGFQLTPKQVETEYDYIRTTFVDMNVSFEYLNPNYKIVALTPVVSDEIATSNANGLRLSTDPSEKLATGQTSIAQMLAAQSFGAIQPQSVPVEYENIVSEPTLEVAPQPTPVAEVEKVVEEVKQEVAEQVEKVATVVEEAQPIVVTAPIQKEAESFEVIYEQPKEQISEAVEEVVETVAEEVETVEEQVEQQVTQVEEQLAEVVEEVQEEITEQVQQVEEIAEETQEVIEEVVETKAEQVEEVVQDIEEAVEEIKGEVVKTPQTIVEKHAQVDLSEFNTVQSRKVLVLKDDDEIIEFEPASLLEKVEKSASLPKVITPITSKETNKIADEIVKNQQLAVDTVQQEVAKVDAIVDEVKSVPVDVNVTQSEVTTSVADVPAVVIPPAEVKLPEVEKVQKVAEEVKEVAEEVASVDPEVDEAIQKEVDISADKALEDILEAEKNAVQKAEEVIQEKPKKSWFGWFKRNKKSEISKDVDGIELNEEQDFLDDTSAELENALDEIPSVDPVDELKFVEQVKQDVVEVKQEVSEAKQEVVEEIKEEVKQEVIEVKQDVKSEAEALGNFEIPLIRTTKAEIEEPKTEVEVAEQKKKFTWWWKRKKSDVAETECVPEEKAKNKKIDWKKFFTPEPKSEIKIAEPENADITSDTELEEKVSE